MSTPQSVIDFWKKAGPQRWFAKDDAFDTTFRDMLARTTTDQEHAFLKAGGFAG